MWQPTHVKVTVRQAKDLLVKGKNGTNDAFVVIGIGKETYQTSVKHKAGPSLFWREECELSIPTQGNKAALQLTAYHRNSLGLDEFLGQVNFPLTDFDVYEKPKYRFHKLLSKPDKAKKKEKERGEIEIMVNFTVKSGSHLDISKKEKNKSTNSLKHLSGSLMSFGRSKDKHGLKDFARSVSSKIDKVTKKKGKSRKDSGALPNELLESQQHFGDADPGVISDDDDEFRFDDDVKVYTQSNSPHSTISRGSSFMMQEPAYDASNNSPKDLRRKSYDDQAPPIVVNPPSPAVVQDSDHGITDSSNHSFYSTNDVSTNKFYSPVSDAQPIEEEDLPDFSEERELKWGRSALVSEPQDLYPVQRPKKKISTVEEVRAKTLIEDDGDSVIPSKPISSEPNESFVVMETSKPLDKSGVNNSTNETMDEEKPTKIVEKIQVPIHNVEEEKKDKIISPETKKSVDKAKRRQSFPTEKLDESQDTFSTGGFKRNDSHSVKNHFDTNISRTGSLNEGQTNRPKALPRTAITGSNGNVSLNDSQTSLSASRTSSSYDVRREDFRQPEIKALTLDRRPNGDDNESEGRKRKKITAFKNKIFHNKGNRDRLEEDSRYVEGGNDKVPSITTRSSKLPQEIHDKFSGKSREDLLEMILNLQGSLSKQVQHSNDLEDYIDNLLLRVMEATPDILQSSNAGRRIKSFGSY